MSCRIITPKAPNGEDSRVFVTIAKLYGVEVGLAAQLHMHTDTFKSEVGDWQNGDGVVNSTGEPEWTTVLDNLNSTYGIGYMMGKFHGVTKPNGKKIAFTEKDANVKESNLNKMFIGGNISAVAMSVKNDDGSYNIDIDAKINTDISYAPSINDDAISDKHRMMREQRKQDKLARQANNSSAKADRKMSRMDKKKPDLKGHKYRKLIAQLKLRNFNLERNVGVLETALARARDKGDTSLVEKLRSDISKHKVTILDNDVTIDSVINTKRLSNILNVAVKDLGDVKMALRRDDLTINELQNMKQIINFWVEAGRFTDKEKHLIFDKRDLTSDKEKDNFRIYGAIAEEHLATINAKLDKHMVDFVNSQTQKTTTIDDIKNISNDIDAARALGLHIGRSDNTILQSIYKAVRRANVRAATEYTEKEAEIDKILKAVMPHLNDTDPFEVFAQTDSNNNRTGDMINLVSADFDSAMELNYTSVMYNKDSTKEQKTKAANWRRKNVIMFDVRKLYNDELGVVGTIDGNVPFTEEQRQEHINELKDHMGESQFDKYMERADKLMDDYKMDLHAYSNMVFADTSLTEEQQFSDIDAWKKVNSPFYAAKNFVDDKRIRGAGKQVTGKKGQRYTVMIPRRIEGKLKKIKGGSIVVDGDVETNHYDKKFEAIVNNKPLYDFWNYYTKSMAEFNKFLPASKRRRLKESSVMYAKQLNFDTYDTKHNNTDLKGKGREFVHDVLVNLYTTPNQSNIAGDTTDPSNNEQVRYVQATFIRDNKEQLNDILLRKQIIFKSKEGRDMTTEETLNEKSKILHVLASQKSFNLGYVLKTYAANITSYKHKAAIEDKIHLANNIFNQIHQNVKNSNDEILEDKYGDKKTDSKGLKNFKNQLDHYLDYFDNYKIKDASGVREKKTYTAEEKVIVAEIDAALELLKNAQPSTTKEDKQRHADIVALEKQKAELGSHAALSAAGDSALKWVQFLSMGFNWSAAVVNFCSGQLQNIINAASGHDFSEASYWKGFREVSAAGMVYMNTSNGRKIKNLDTKWKTLQSNLDFTTQENKNGKSIIGRVLNRINPYGLGQYAETMNQSPIAIAILNDHIITDKDGNKSGVWDALDENLDLKEEFATEENMAAWSVGYDEEGNDSTRTATIAKIQEVIIGIHANYNTDAPVRGTRTVYGRAAAQLKRWIPEAIEQRFGKEYQNDQLDRIVKGRYRSIVSAKDSKGNELKWFEAMGNQFKVFAMKMTAGYYDADADLAEVDMKNMLANARGIQMVLALYILQMLLTSMRSDGDDEEQAGLIFAINSSSKVMSELTTWSGTGVLDLFKNPLPVMRIGTELVDIGDAILKTAGGDATISSGINADRWRIGKEFMEATPVLNQINKINTLISKEITSPKDLSKTTRDLITDYISDYDVR